MVKALGQQFWAGLGSAEVYLTSFHKRCKYCLLSTLRSCPLGVMLV